MLVLPARLIIGHFHHMEMHRRGRARKAVLVMPARPSPWHDSHRHGGFVRNGQCWRLRRLPLSRKGLTNLGRTSSSRRQSVRHAGHSSFRLPRGARSRPTAAQRPRSIVSKSKWPYAMHRVTKRAVLVLPARHAHGAATLAVLVLPARLVVAPRVHGGAQRCVRSRLQSTVTVVYSTRLTNLNISR